MLSGPLQRGLIRKRAEEYGADLHGVHNFAVKRFRTNTAKLVYDVWRQLISFYWFSGRRAEAFLRDIDPSNTRIKRVLCRLQLFKNPDNIEEVSIAGDNFDRSRS